MTPALKQTIMVLLSAIGFMTTAKSQLCTGSLGDPVVNVTFGSGSNPGPSLAAATTSYHYVSYNCPNDGYYTVANSSSGCFQNTWQTIRDHTGNPNGYFMLINASFEPSDFYLDTVKGLCQGTTFEFAAWILNMLVPDACNGSGIMPIITFNIETTSGAVLQTYNTGNINTSNAASWKQYGFYFKTPPGITDIVLRMTNNAPGGCGNDLALDDITFRPCGPRVNITVAGSFGGRLNLCEGDPTVLGFSSVVSQGYTSPAYQWQVSKDSGSTWMDIAGATSLNYSRLPTGIGTFLYRMIVAEIANIGLTTCRVASNVTTINVNANPVTTATNTGPACAGSPFYLEGTGGTVYKWTGPDGFTGDGEKDSVINTTAGSAVYQLIVTNSFGCSKSDSTTVLIYPIPIAKFSYSSPTCENSDINFKDGSDPSGQSLVKWQWNFGDGVTSTLQNPDHIFAASGSDPVTLTTQTNNGCTGTVTTPVLIHPLPQPYFGIPEICLTDPFASFSDSSTISDVSEAGFTWKWNFGDPNATAGNPNTSALQNPQHKYIATGNYIVGLTVTSKDGCSKDTTRAFTVNGQFPVASFTINNNGQLCSNRQVTITDGSTVDFGNITKVEIYWDYLNDPLARTIDENPAKGKQYPFSYPDFGIPLVKTFQVRYVAYSGIGCLNETTQTLTVNASPQVVFDKLTPVCQDVAPFSFTQARDTAGLPGSGVYSGSGTSVSGLFNPGVAGAGTDSVYYTFTATNGCSTRAGQTIVVYPQPTADAGPDRTVLEGSSITLNGNGTGNSVSYLWLPDSAIDNNHIADPKISPVNDIMYTLTVTSADGCSDSSHVLITVLKKPIVPNAFSPNGDGVNDTWVIKYLDSYPGAEVTVFNRYGQPVLHEIGYGKPWDGRYNGQPLPVATYYWIINPKNGRAQMSGSVTIIR